MAPGIVNRGITEIVRDYYDSVYRFCARRVGEDLAADVAQDTFLTAQRVLGKYRGDSSIQTWLFGIAFNECRRTMKKQRMNPCSLDFDIPVEGAELAWIDGSILRDSFDTLKPTHREVVTLHALDGLTYQEIAVVLGIPVGTVKSRLHNALGQLRNMLKEKTDGHS